MPTKVHKNTFQGGMEKEIDPTQVENHKYVDSSNTSTSQDGMDRQLATFHGTNILDTLIPSGTVVANTNVHVMGMYEAIAKIDTDDTSVAVVFVYNEASDRFDVFIITEAGTVFNPYYETSLVLADTARFVDCVIYKEAGVTSAYFTNYEGTIKKLPLVITTLDKGDVTPYTKEEIVLLRTGFRGSITNITLDNAANGDLLCGSYQFSWRLFNSNENKYTKWTLLSNPIIIGMGYSTTEQSFGGVGYVSDYGIDIELTTAEDYSSLYTHYQLAVVENTNGGDDSSLKVKILQPEVMSDFVLNVATYTYDTNKQAKEITTIDELTIDDAPIETVKTLAVKNNRLILGNVKYHSLDYDNDNPAVGVSTAPVNTRLTGGKAVAYRDYENASEKVGHFRDELYRYGVVYEDGDGNYSKPKILDFSGLTAGNNAATAGTDFRFPSRNHEKYGPLLETNGDIQVLALQINDLVNHPTWAKKVHIVRVPRKKKIQFQTPLVPAILVQPAKAYGGYPDQRDDNSGTELDVLNVEATNPDGSYIPKNYFHVLPKNLLRFGDFYGTVITSGGLYGTHNINSGTYQYVPAAVNETITGTDGYTIYTSDNEAGPYYRHKDIDSEVVVRMRWTSDPNPPVGFKDIEADDALTVYVKRSADLTTEIFSVTVQTLTNYDSVSPSSTINAMDFSQYNYLIEVYKT